MAKYTVKFYRGDYYERQMAANKDKAVVYVEQHFNSATPTADYSCVVVANNASRTSREFGQLYARRVSEEFGCTVGGVNGIFLGGFNGRGNANLVHTSMPAVLLEPLFVSNPKRAEQVRSVEGRQTLAEIIAECVRHFFPGGGLVAFSVGHKYKKTNPNDRGAAVHGGGTEADYAEMVLDRAKELLEAEEVKPCGT